MNVNEDLNVTGAVNVVGPVDVEGSLTTHAATVAGLLDVGGLTIHGKAHLEDSLLVQGPPEDNAIRGTSGSKHAAGVCGVGDKAAGVEGFSSTGLGGQFRSQYGTGAQIESGKSQLRLIPNSVPFKDTDDGGRHPVLPIDGEPGEIRVFMDEDETCQMWLCVTSLGRTGPLVAPATWAQIQLGPASWGGNF
ncbi:hypothetical protein ACFQ7J_02185 [Streptomyces sp. NPDC056501]|uniref:hypothetical protein n=1 Tax=Streptomyces sp. NPDC056501 TaxID=3345841 RepID=UPI0036C5B08C